MSVINSIFKRIDDEVNQLIIDNPLEKGNQFEELSKLYWDSWEHLKNKMGTSAGWPWFGEYIVFYAVKQHIENIMDVEFKISSKYEFKSVKIYSAKLDSKNVILGHNACLKLNDSPDVRPDIFLRVNNNRLIFSIDVKVSITSTWAMARKKGGALSKLSRTIADSKWENNPLGYLICLDRKMPTPADRCTIYQREGVRIVGPRGGSIEQKLANTDFPMTTFQTCINEIIDML